MEKGWCSTQYLASCLLYLRHIKNEQTRGKSPNVSLSFPSVGSVSSCSTAAAIRVYASRASRSRLLLKSVRALPTQPDNEYL